MRILCSKTYTEHIIESLNKKNNSKFWLGNARHVTQHWLSIYDYIFEYQLYIW